MALNDAEMIEIEGRNYLVFTEEETRSPTLYMVEVAKVPTELYEEVYEKFIASKYD
jgi:hypothetical protein